MSPSAPVAGATNGAPPPDAWLTVVGTFRGVSPDGIPELDAVSIQPQQAPVDPYE